MNKKTVHFLTALVLYIAFGVYLYRPYFGELSRVEYLGFVSMIFGAVGCFIISTRWVLYFGPALIAGAVYGFGPLCLSLLRYHPTVSLLAAAVPWLFIPSVFGPKGKLHWLRVPFSLIPFGAIILFFYLGAQQKLFVMPIYMRLHVKDLPSLIFPMVMVKKRLLVLGFYHVPIAGLLIGFSMLIKAKRFAVLLILLAGVLLSCIKPFLFVSPIIWSVIAMLCCAVIIGEGFQGLMCAGKADRKWVISGSIVLMVLCLVALLFTTRCQNVFAGQGISFAKIFTHTAQVYILGSISIAILFLIAQLNLRLVQLRWFLVMATVSVDIVMSGRFIFDQVM